MVVFDDLSDYCYALLLGRVLAAPYNYWFELQADRVDFGSYWCAPWTNRNRMKALNSGVDLQWRSTGDFHEKVGF